MKLYTIISISLLALASCSGNGNKNADTTKNAGADSAHVGKLTTPSQNMEYCFIRAEGNSNQDTTAIHLIIKANKVSGNLQWLPKEKDARKGILLGNISGNDIKAVWTFMQEGIKDTLAVEFKLSAQQLAQKPFKVNRDGRQVTDSSADYTILYKLDNCEKFKTELKPALHN